MVETTQLTKRYGSLTALDQCSLHVPPGQVFGLLGPNGSGKSTLLRILVGMVRPTSGSASIQGLDCWRQSVKVRQATSYLPGDARLFRWHRGVDVLNLLSTARRADPQVAIQLAKRLQLDLNRRVAMMSTGMRQKLAIAAVMAAPCAVLILDEPTANLDPSVRMEVLQLVREAQQRGQTVLFSSHVLSEVEEVCDRVLLLRYGKVAHLQDMATLRQGHRIWADLGSELPAPDPQWSKHVTIQQSGAHVQIDASSHLAHALRWLSQVDLTSLRIEPLGLRTVYAEHFEVGAEQARADAIDHPAINESERGDGAKPAAGLQRLDPPVNEVSE